MKQYLVTGGAGFIGSHLVRALVTRGERVRVFDNFSTGRRENLQGISGPLEVFEGDLRDTGQVTEAVQGMDYILHHAAFISVPQSMQEPQECYDINVQGTQNLLDAAGKAGVRQVVIASSAAVYGDSQDLPLSENTAPRPLSPYAASKQIDEVLAGLYTRAFDLPVVALRYFNVFGPRQSPNSPYAAAIPIFVRRILDGAAPTIFGDGHQTRDFIYVGDVVRANLLAAETPEAAGQVFNVCTGQAIDLIELLETLSEVMKFDKAPVFGPPRAGDIYRSVGDPSRAAQALNFRPQTSLAEGLAETVDWMRRQRTADTIHS